MEYKLCKILNVKSYDLPHLECSDHMYLHQEMLDSYWHFCFSKQAVAFFSTEAALEPLLECLAHPLNVFLLECLQINHRLKTHLKMRASPLDLVSYQEGI